MTLYDLTQQYKVLLEMASDPDIDPSVFQDTLEAVDGELEEKADAYAIILKELDADERKIDGEIARLNGRKRNILENKSRMKANLQRTMVETGKTKFKTALFSFGIRKNPVSVAHETDDWRKIPEKYLKHENPSINWALIKEDLKKGEQLQGIGHLEQTERISIT